MSARGVPSETRRICPHCGGIGEGKCEDCGRHPASTTIETPENKTVIDLEVRRNVIIFPQGEVPPILGIPSDPRGKEPAESGPLEKAVRQRRPLRATCAALALTLILALALGRWWERPFMDPLMEFSEIAYIDADDAQMESWARSQFASADLAELDARVSHARAALEREVEVAMAWGDHRPTDWSEIAAWASIAQVLGTHDIEMLALAADLNVQMALHAPGLSSDDQLRRIARARRLLRRQEMHENSGAVVGRIARKLSDLDKMELALDPVESGKR